MNPLQAHWLRIALWLFIGTPVVALAVALTTDVGFGFAITVTLYMWVLVCVILALIALAGLAVRLLGRGLRAIRR
jgi:hypothetical protein